MRLMPFFSPSEQLENVRLARRLWLERVEPQHVELGVWRCSSHACFGGHLATWPEFRKWGVFDGAQGVPLARSETGLTVNGGGVSQRLFGSNLFEARGPDDIHASDSDSDYQVVLKRLDAAEKQLQQVVTTSAQVAEAGSAQ